LTKVLTPLTGFLQRRELPVTTKRLSPWTRGLYHCLRCFNWCCSGAVTLTSPHMRYNPLKARCRDAQWEWASKILHYSPKKLREIATAFLIKQQYKTSKRAITSRSQQISFTILLCFHRHLKYFKSCLYSIQEAFSHAPQAQFEIMLINDDPSIDLSSLLASLDSSLRQKIILRTHANNQGICSSLNEAIIHAQGEWLIYLDCDDLLEPDVFTILEKAIHQYPGIRFISSRAADIDTDGDVLCWRLRSEQPYELMKRNFADHLKVIKKELHQDLGLLKKTFEGCQDYEFALRTAINEPLLFIPDYLYRYRWHHESQTVSQNKHQNLTAMRVRQSYMLAIYWLTHGTETIEWNITGPEAASWKEHLASMTHENFQKNPQDQIRYHVTLEATTVYEPLHWKLLLVELATIIIDRHREKDPNTFLTVKT